MNILVAPDKFKGLLSAWEVCEAVTKGVLLHHSNHHITAIPLADGGEGTLEIVNRHLHLQTIEVKVQDPLFRTLSASYKMHGDTAYIEMATASGLHLLTEAERNCLYTTSLGTGQLIADAYSRGAREFYLFIGGSATNDGGIGILQALGIYAKEGSTNLLPIGESLPKITDFDLTARLVPNGDSIHFNIICDVKNPLYGPNGAAHVYGPQKGADKKSVELLDQGLRNLAEVVLQEQHIDVAHFEGSGAAGGIAAGIKAFFPTTIRSGIETVMEMVNLSDAVAKADLVISGEGKLDGQTLEGKVISGVQRLCLQQKKPLGIICGILSLTSEELESQGFWRVEALVQDDTDVATAMNQAYALVSQRTHHMLKSWGSND